MYANTTTGHRPHVTGSKSSRVLQQLIVFNTVSGVIIQDQTQTTEEWFGLSYTDVQSIYEASETSVLNGVTRHYFGSAKLAQNTTPGAWCRTPSCWGTQITTSYDRMGDTNLYHVTKTTTEFTVRSSGGNVTLTLE